MNLTRIFRLSARDVAIACEAAALAVPVEIALRLVPIDTLVARLGRAGRRGRRSDAAFDVERTARLLDALASVYPLNATCLKKSLVLFWILSRRGIPVELRLGVRKVQGDFSAHAWIDCDGRTLLGGGIAHLFTPMPLKRIG